MFNPAQSVSAQANPIDALAGVDRSNKTAVRDASEKYESVFLKNMLEAMFTGLEEGGTWGSGNGAEAWRGMMIDEYAKSVSDAGGIGLADTIERQLLELQENSQ
ncbi:rod-binding protein [Labrenzia sp. CE80]|uniref:rod-binding protein n=1 Tax=Labrenzia sp. CE80 TaxID=1788986 RepID=UPI00129A98D2|nr:rod-binding protein [Labrenzia sp. CE80]